MALSERFSRGKLSACADTNMRVQQYQKFCGQDLRRGCQTISIFTALACLLTILFTIYGLLVGPDFIAEAQKAQPNIKVYGGRIAFERILGAVCVVNIVQFFFCYFLHSGARMDNNKCIMHWVRWSVVRLFAHGTFIPYVIILLYAASAIQHSIAVAVILAIVFPTDIYLILVVNNYRKLISPETTIWRLPTQKMVLLPISPPLHF